jgi:carbonic anhydrase
MKIAKSVFFTFLVIGDLVMIGHINASQDEYKRASNKPFDMPLKPELKTSTATKPSTGIRHKRTSTITKGTDNLTIAKSLKIPAQKKETSKKTSLLAKSIQSPTDLNQSSVEQVNLHKARVGIRFNKPTYKFAIRQIDNTILLTPLAQNSVSAKAKSTKNGSHKTTYQSRYRSYFSNYVMFDGNRYNLYNIDFHIPCEHTINGKKQYPIEIHILCQDKQGHFAVVAFFAREGAENKQLKSLVKALNNNQLNNANARIRLDLNKLVPWTDRNIYKYNGSTIAHKPREFNVPWAIFKQPIELSKKQIKTLQNAIANKSEKLEATE